MCEKHDCRPFPDRFSKRFLCLLCGKEFVEKNSESINIYHDLYNQILSGIDGEGFMPLSSDAIIIYINERLSALK